MFTYHVEDSLNTKIEFDPSSNNTWNGQNLLDAYVEEIDIQRKGRIEDVDGFHVYKFGDKILGGKA